METNILSDVIFTSKRDTGLINWRFSAIFGSTHWIYSVIWDSTCICGPIPFSFWWLRNGLVSALFLVVCTVLLSPYRHFGFSALGCSRVKRLNWWVHGRLGPDLLRLVTRLGLDTKLKHDEISVSALCLYNWHVVLILCLTVQKSVSSAVTAVVICGQCRLPDQRVSGGQCWMWSPWAGHHGGSPHCGSLHA